MQAHADICKDVIAQHEQDEQDYNYLDSTHDTV